MGVTYKLSPELTKFILSQKHKNPSISCRQLSVLIEKKLNLKISKSAVNSIIKQEGLSNPKGRVASLPSLLSKKQIIPENVTYENMGLFFLKASDLSLGGMSNFAQSIHHRLVRVHLASIQAKNEILLYKNLFGLANLEDFKNYTKFDLWALIGKTYSYIRLYTYLRQIHTIKSLSLEFFNILTNCLQEVSSIKFVFKNNTCVFLDASLHSLWSNNNSMPKEFSLSLNNVKNILAKNEFIFLAVPGYNFPTKEFFDLFTKPTNYVTLLDETGSELEKIKFNKIPSLVFGLWPWQYQNAKTYQIKQNIGKIISPLTNEELHLSKGEVILVHPKLNQKIILRAGFLSKNKKEILVVLTNIPEEENTITQITQNYLSCWPTQELGFEEFSKKIEEQTYIKPLRIKPSHLPAWDKIYSLETSQLQLEELLRFWLNHLDYYARSHYFPKTYATYDFLQMKEKFYNLSGKIKKKPEYLEVTFLPEKSSLNLEDLSYACNRVNEANIIDAFGRRIYFRI
ncbi:MAG: hypothetical protein AB1472_00550 [Candidatus Omnitrophota bacterium]